MLIIYVDDHPESRQMMIADCDNGQTHFTPKLMEEIMVTIIWKGFGDLIIFIANKINISAGSWHVGREMSHHFYPKLSDKI